MTINTDLFIAAPMLQDYLVDKDSGEPLTNGIVTLWRDNSRYVTYKNWYYQTGTPGNYTWVALDNPLTLSSAGTIQDPNGNDVIPFYYPYNEDDSNITEPYFITVYSADENGNPAELQFTRENFPFVPSNSSPVTQNPTWRNYILNNVYWRNIGSLDAAQVTDQIIAPSQHEGYTNGDIRFIKDITGANDDLIFSPMTETLDNDITPEYYINMQCSGVQLGETVKCIQYPISLHVKTLQNVQATVVIQAQNVSGSSNNYIDVQIYQYTGTGALTASNVVPFGPNNGRIVLNNDFTKFTLTDFLPDASGLSLGQGGDDALFLRISFPLSALFNINHTKPQIYLSEDVPDNDFDTYDQVESIINSPRTGDYKTSLNSFQPFGYVAANDGSIGSPTSGATCRANNDTWPLYNLLWGSILNAWCPVSTGRGVSAYADFTANKTLTLTRNLGRVMAGLNPVFDSPVTFTVNTGTDVLTLSSARTLTVGTPVQVTNSGGGLPSPLAANTVYFVSVNSLTTTTIKLSTTIENAYAGTDIDITTAGTGTQTIQSALGAYRGESLHTQLETELARHHHLPTGTPAGGTPAFVVDKTSGSISIGGGGTLTSGQPTTADTGNSTPFNVIQPTMYSNVFIKL